MKERPILMSAPMVRALLAGRKTQTRRVVTVPWHNGKRCAPYAPYYRIDDGKLMAENEYGDGKLMAEDEYGDWHEQYRYGKPGDRLWVRETFRATDTHGFFYRADYGEKVKGPWTPSIFMRRHQSRITLDIVAVRVERLQEISYSDVLAEGVGRELDEQQTDAEHVGYTIEGYRELWTKINGKTDGKRWIDNPWVWVISFRPVTP
jgi:hypothetical protein